MIRNILLLSSYLLLLASLQGNAQPTAGINPLLADPTIVLYKNTYYLYGTDGHNSNDGFTVFTSDDKINWQKGKNVLEPGKAFGTRGFWAPQVFPYKGKFFMAYTADEHIAIATASGPLGPFTQTAIRSLATPVKMIDPFVFFDGGKIYLYHVRLNEGNKIYVAELNNDLSAIKENTLRLCIEADGGWEDTKLAPWKVAEGPTVLKYKGWYYLIYSANDFRNPDYAVGYAVSKSPEGPWEKYKGNPVLSQRQLGIPGTGHGDVLKDEGRMYYVFHTHDAATKVSPRKTAITPIHFKESGRRAPLLEFDHQFKYLKSDK